MSSLPNIYLIGPMGAGKTTLGRYLARELGLEFYDSDKEIETRSGVNIPWIFDVEGEEGFRDRETRILDELTQLRNIVLATGGGAVLRPENRAFLSARGVVIYLKTSIEQQLSRTKKCKNRPLLQTENVREKLLQLKNVRDPLYTSIANLILETEQYSVGSLAEKIINYIRHIQ